MELKIEIGIGRKGQAGIFNKVKLETGGDLKTATTWGDLKEAAELADVEDSDKIYLMASMGAETVLEIIH